MAKSPEAFRTISEVSAFLETPPHVLRFWESKFAQVKPVKRAGGRRYYRPDDISLLGGIKVLLHEQGMTIRGVQKMLREQGVRYVSSLAPQSWGDDGSEGGGVIIGPWRGPGVDPGMDDLDPTGVDGDDLAALALEDGVSLADEEEYDGEVVDLLADEELAVVGAGADERPDGGSAGAPEAAPSGPAGQSLIFDFLAGTIDHLAASAAARRQVDDAEPAAPEPSDEPVADPVGEPLPAGEPTLDRALMLLRRADPARLRARGDRIGPLVARLRALTAPGGSAHR